MIGQLHAAVIEVEATAHPAPVQTGITRDLLEIVQNFITAFVVEVFGGCGGIVKAELDGRAGDFPEAFQIGDDLRRRIVFIEDAVHSEGDRQTG